MFRTYPESQMAVSIGFSPGHRSWHWFELAGNLPIYLAHIHAVDAEITRQFFLTEFDQLLKNLSKYPFNEEGGKLEALYLIAPGYVSGLPHPTLVELAEVWAKPNDYLDLLYVGRDGQRLRFTLTDEPAPETELQCVLKIEPGHTTGLD